MPPVHVITEAAEGLHRRRHPACGSELEHGPHEYTFTSRADGTRLDGQDKDPAQCAGWTAAEADLCVMLTEVHVAMLEKAPPGGAEGSGRFRLECSPAVVAGLAGLLLGPRRVTHLYGAEVVITMLGEGRWQLSEVAPPLVSGTIRQ